MTVFSKRLAIKPDVQQLAPRPPLTEEESKSAMDDRYQSGRVGEPLISQA